MKATWRNANGESGEFDVPELPPDVVCVPTCWPVDKGSQLTLERSQGVTVANTNTYEDL